MGHTADSNPPRVGVVLVAHGDSGAALLAAAEEVLGRALTAIEVVGHPASEPRDVLSARVHDAANRIDGGGGTLFLVDLCGSTPGNVCLDCCRELAGRGEVVFGVNLPMLVKVATLDRSRSVLEVANGVYETGKRSVRTLRDLTQPVVVDGRRNG